jgi:hypothetical protein
MFSCCGLTADDEAIARDGAGYRKRFLLDLLGLMFDLSSNTNVDVFWSATHTISDYARAARLLTRLNGNEKAGLVVKYR